MKSVNLPLPELLKELLDTWDIRLFVSFSLSLQILLIFCAPLRKRKSSKLVNWFIWSAYLIADWVAVFALGLISHSQRYASVSKRTDKENVLMAFWAPFLLLHLGGPDTITAFALEDNELWLRHLLGLLFHLFTAGYVFFQSLNNNNLFFPTVLVFLAGIWKYAERTRALYLASLGRFKDSMLQDPDPGPNYAKLMDEYSSKKFAKLPTDIVITKEPEKGSNISINDEQGPTGILLSNVEAVDFAFRFFETFKGIIVDLIFSFHERNRSREFFLRRNAEEAFRVVAIELNFLYDVFYTKAVVVNSVMGYICRFLCVTFVLAAFVLFWIGYDRQGLSLPDIYVTFALLGIALVLDFLAFFMFFFSNWTIVSVNIPMAKSVVSFVLTKCPVFKTPKWSESIFQFNLLSYCLHEGPEWVNKVSRRFGLSSFLDEILYKSSKPVDETLKDFIFAELTSKSREAEDYKMAKHICSCRGDWVLKDNTDWKNLLEWSIKVEYDESLLLWHIATELCFHTDCENDDINRRFCKQLSDYMLYLLIMQPTLMSMVAGIGQIRFRDTCAEIKRFFSKKKRVVDWKCSESQACEMLLRVNTDIIPAYVKGDRSKSVVFDACRLAKQLKKLEDYWKLMSKVWVELLSYAAGHCLAKTHAQQLSEGGELVSFVWLLMAHLGLGDQFRIEAGHARAKLVVQK